MLCLITSGKEIKKIPGELALSARKISIYSIRLMEKMNMETNDAHHLLAKYLDADQSIYQPDQSATITKGVNYVSSRRSG
ncbi:MAG: hypothetical protein ABFD50_23435 [Smithella sp.]